MTKLSRYNQPLGAFELDAIGSKYTYILEENGWADNDINPIDRIIILTRGTGWNTHNAAMFTGYSTPKKDDDFEAWDQTREILNALNFYNDHEVVHHIKYRVSQTIASYILNGYFPFSDQRFDEDIPKYESSGKPIYIIKKLDEIPADFFNSGWNGDPFYKEDRIPQIKEPGE